jgi:hypothetical protein
VRSAVRPRRPPGWGRRELGVERGLGGPQRLPLLRQSGGQAEVEVIRVQRRDGETRSAEQVVHADGRYGDRRAGLAGDTGGIGHVVEVRMTDEDVISPGHFGRVEAE